MLCVWDRTGAVRKEGKQCPSNARENQLLIRKKVSLLRSLHIFRTDKRFASECAV